MVVLFDASALFKRYSGERGAERVQAVQAQARQIVAAAHCRTEVASALSRQWRDGLFTDTEYARVLSAIHQDFDQLDVLPISAEIERAAILAMRRSPLRAMDALHIGSAQAAAVDLFVTADRRQADAAREAGLLTECVEA